MKTESERISPTAQNLKDALKVRPNTGLAESFLQDNLVVCTGEDPQELKQAIQAVLPGKRPRVHQYRCYRAWKFSRPKITIILSGIGTGALEPLLFEVLDYNKLGDKVAKRLVMIGTAGYLSESGFGQVYLVDGAYPVGCGVTLEEKELPVLPNFQGLDRCGLPRREEISTDYYYACTPQETDVRKVMAKSLNPTLREGLRKYWQSDRLISMETAQFYHLARCYGQVGTQYVAFRGVANLADRFDTQAQYSVQVLTEALRQAVALLSANSG